MPVVIFRKDEPDRAREAREPRRRAPAEFGRVAPPHMCLSEQQAENRARHGDYGAQQREDDVRDRAQESVQQYLRIAREYRVIPVRPATVVMCPQVELAHACCGT